MESSLTNFYLTKGGEETIEEFKSGVIERVERWIKSDPVVVIGVLPTGVFYASPLAERLKGDGREIEYAEIDARRLRNPKREIKLIDREGKDFSERELGERKILVVNDILITDETYERIREGLKEKNLRKENIKFAVFEDRTGLADFRYRITPDVLIREEFFASAKESLQELQPLKKKLLSVWKEVPPEYQSEMLAVLLSNTREWREWEREGEISAHQVMDWLRDSLMKVAYAYPDIRIPDSFKTPDILYINKSKGVL